jgi:hypothetical protein
VPSTTDILICRSRSVAGGMTAMAQQWAKDTGKPAIFENGQSGILRAMRKLQAPTTTKKVKAQTPQFVLDIQRLDTLLENAPGRNMSWLASALRTDTGTLMPALMEAGRFTEVSATLNMIPVPEEEPPTPVVRDTPSEANIREWAATVQSERGDDPIQTRVAVLSHLCGGAVADEILRNALNRAWEPSSTTSTESEPMTQTSPPFLMPDASTAPPIGTQWRPAVPLHRLQEFIPIGIDVAERWESRDRERVARAFLNRDAKSHKDFPKTKGILKKHHRLFSELKGKPLAFIATLMWIIPQGTTITKRSFEAAYREIFDKGMDTRMVGAIGWAMEVQIRTAAKKTVAATSEAPEFEGLRPEESPMAGVCEPLTDADPGWLASGPSNLMEAFEALRQEVVALRSELRELKSPRASVTLNDLMAAGATISITPREQS